MTGHCVGQLLSGVWGQRGLPGVAGQGLADKTHPTSPARSRAGGHRGTAAAPVLGIRYFLGDGLKPGRHVRGQDQAQ